MDTTVNAIYDLLERIETQGGLGNSERRLLELWKAGKLSSTYFLYQLEAYWRSLK